MNGLEIFLIFFYTVSFCFVISKTTLFDSPYVSKRFLIFIFIVKILVAYLYAYIHFENGWRDTFAMFVEGKLIARLFFEDPDLYFRFVFGEVERPFTSEIADKIGVDTLRRYGRPRTRFLVQMNALFIPFCYGYYSVLCIIYVFLSLLGVFNIYNFVAKRFGKNDLLKLFLFFSPSILFWLSGLHKDGITLFGLSLILFAIDKVFTKKIHYLLVVIFAFVFTFLARDYALFIFIPSLIGYVISRLLKQYKLAPYPIIYGVAILLFFTGKFISPQLNFPQKFVGYQNGFERLSGGSNIEMMELEPTIESFAESVPIALFNTTFKPIFPGTESMNVWSRLAAFENIIYLLATVLILFFMKKINGFNNEQKSILVFFGLFSVSYILTLGLVVDNIGAMVRYKSVPLVFLACVIILLFNPKRMETYLKIKNKFFSKHVEEIK